MRTALKVHQRRSALSVCPSVSQWTVQTPLPCLLFQLAIARPKLGIYSEAIVPPSDEGDGPFPCRTETPGVRDRAQSNSCFSARTAGAGRRAGTDTLLRLAVDGGAVCFGFPRGADYPHEAVSELLQDQALRFGLRLVSLFCLLGLFQQTLARRFEHLLCYERVRQPAGRWQQDLSEKYAVLHGVSYHHTLAEEVTYSHNTHWLKSEFIKRLRDSSQSISDDTLWYFKL